MASGRHWESAGACVDGATLSARGHCDSGALAERVVDLHGLGGVGGRGQRGGMRQHGRRDVRRLSTRGLVPVRLSGVVAGGAAWSWGWGLHCVACALGVETGF